MWKLNQHRGPRERSAEGWQSPRPTLFQEALAELGFWGRGGQAGRSQPYPVIIKFAGDNSGSQGARRVHGAAGVVDLQGSQGPGRREVRTDRKALQASPVLDLNLKGVHAADSEVHVIFIRLRIPLRLVWNLSLWGM